MTTQIQTLEPRRLLSASASVSGGTLTVTGSNRADNIEVSIVFGGVTVRAEGRQVFSGGEVSRLVVRGDNGDDRITYSNERTQIDTKILGENGNDRMEARAVRAAGAEVE